MKPCLTCGQPTESTRCDEHTVKAEPVKPNAKTAARGYNGTWNKLSKRARRLQPFCSDCGATERLSGDHSPEAWRRVADGLPIRLVDIDVVCLRCNNRRGAARGDGVTRGSDDRTVKAHTQLGIGTIPDKDGPQEGESA